jgi:predicted transcriptional regulator of viral defense system
MHPDLSPLPPAFLTAEATAAGISPRRLITAVGSGVVERLDRGIYAHRERWPTDRVQQHRLLARAAHRAVSDSAISHVSAALDHGLPNPMGALPVRLSPWTISNAHVLPAHG